MKKFLFIATLLCSWLSFASTSAQNVAQIGDTGYETLQAAFNAATDGQTVKVLVAGTYTLPNIPNNITLEGDVDDVVFNHTTAGSIASVPNGATFKNVTFNFGNVNYHGFQHAGTINMEGCTLNGKLFSYGDMNFTNCEFVQANSDYHMWAYSGNLTYTGCTFTNNATGKFINVYNESGATKYTVTANNCTFINNGSANKAALNVKATCPDNGNPLAYDVIVNNCTTQGEFPAPSTSDALIVLNELIQVDDRPAGGVDNITVTLDGAAAYPVAAYVAQIGDVKYPSLAEAIAAVPTDGTATTITMIDNETIVGNAGVTIPVGKNIVLDLNGKTIKGVVENPTTAQTILNQGTLTITDSSDEKNGLITNEVSDENAGSPGNGKNWYSNAITNNGKLTVNAGNIVNTGTGGACYAIDNITNGTICTPVLNIAGGNISALKVTVRMFCNSTTNDNTVNITGGVITSKNAYAIQTQMANESANKAVLNISGGTISGQYAWVDYGDKNTATQFDNAHYNISGGFFSGYLWSYATYYCGMEGFISGGYFDQPVGGDLAAPGFAFVENTDDATKEEYPYATGLADVHYYWLDNNGNIDGGGYYTFYAPFEGPDPVLMSGEFVELQKDITLTKDIEYIEECSFGDPIFKGGTFTLKFGNFNIDLNGYKFPIPTDAFEVAAPEGYKWVSDGDGTSSLAPCVYVAQIGSAKYETLEAAFAAAQDGETITLLADCAGNGIVVPQGKFTTGLTVNFGGFTYTVDGATVGSTGTQTQAFQLLKDNKITFQNGAIYSEKAKILVQNYSDLTLEGMTLTMNNENYTSAYTLSNNNGNVVIDGTTINANPAGGFAFDVCRYASYLSVSVTVQGESVINGDIEIYASGSNAKDGFGLTLMMPLRLQLLKVTSG